MRIAIVTAGGAGMFCGSCMHDNTWARALTAQGADVSLIPTYTPIRLDEEENSNSADLFLGGINVYMDYRWRFWQKVPRPLRHWLDAPWVVNFATKLAPGNDAKRLGALTLAMLEGESGPQRRPIEELVDYLTGQLKPDVICFSNAMLVGALRTLKERFAGRVYCVLQGDDVFLEDLPEPHRSRALDVIRQRARDFDGFLVHSRYYRDFMSDYLQLPTEKMHMIPLGIDLEGHVGRPTLRDNDRFTIGYFARICPEKGLSQLVDAFLILHEEFPDIRLRVGGYLGKRDTRYFRKIEKRVGRLGNAFEYIGSPGSRREKIDFIQSLDVLSVPTVYMEPKGLYVLEAMANGVPVVQPNHGSFPELIENTGGGLLVTPEDPQDLARALKELMNDHQQRITLAEAGHAGVRKKYNPQTMAEATLAIFQNSTPLQDGGT